MSYMGLKFDAPARSVIEVGPGDYVKVGSRWEKIEENSAFGVQVIPRTWTIRTTGGGVYDMWSINLYAKAEDLLSPR